MARYRKIDPGIWNDEKFRNIPDNGKLSVLFVLTHPHMTSIGAMRGTVAGLAAEMGWSFDDMQDAMGHAIRYGMVEVNREASYIGLPNFLKYNEPEGPNSVIKAWPAALGLIPECSEKQALAKRCKSYLNSKGPQFLAKSDAADLWKAIDDAMPDGIDHAIKEPSAIQEQEQEQEQKRKPVSGETGSAQPAADHVPACPHQEIIKLYDKHLPYLPQPRAWDGQRANNLKARWRWVLTAKKPSGERYAVDTATGLGFFDRFFEYASKSDFLTGRNGKWQSCNLVWLVKAENFTKVLEGHYENRQEAAT